MQAFLYNTYNSCKYLKDTFNLTLNSSTFRDNATAVSQSQLLRGRDRHLPGESWRPRRWPKAADKLTS